MRVALGVGGGWDVCSGSVPESGWLSNYDPVLGTLNIRCRIIIGNQKRDHNFDNHPSDGGPEPILAGGIHQWAFGLFNTSSS